MITFLIRHISKGAIKKDTAVTEASLRLHSAFVGQLTAEVLLFPLETILHR